MKRLIVLTLLIGIMGAASCVLALTSFMVFDAPGSEKNPVLWVAFVSALALPVSSFGSILWAWLRYYKSRNGSYAIKIMLLPVFNLAVLIAAMILLQFYCQGSFTCQ